jgi:hypothetical protein
MKRIFAMFGALAESAHRALFRYMARTGMILSVDYTLADLDRYDVNSPGAVEKVRARLYDYQLYPTAGLTQMTFFAVPKGQGLSSSPGAAALTKGPADTNMTLAGQLPSPQAFIVESIEALIFPGLSAAANTFTPQQPAVFAVASAAAVNAGVTDVYMIGVGAFVDFFIGSKSYLTDAPLGCFPPKTYFGLDAAVASTSATVGESVLANGKWCGRPYYLDPPMTLRATQNFNVTLNWPVVIATPSGFNARVGIALDGVLFRKAQ